MGLLGKLFGTPHKPTADEQYEKATGAKTTADAAYEKATGAKPTKAAATVAKHQSSGGRLSGIINNPAFQNFANNAVANSNNIMGNTNYGQNRDLIGIGGGGRAAKKKHHKNKLSPAFYDPKTGKTYIAKSKQKSKGKSKSKKKDDGGFSLF